MKSSTRKKWTKCGSFWVHWFNHAAFVILSVYYCHESFMYFMHTSNQHKKWHKMVSALFPDGNRFFSLRKLTGKWHQWIKNITFYPFELWTVPYDVVVNRLFSLIFLYSTFSWFIDSVQWCISCFYHDLALSFWTEDQITMNRKWAGFSISSSNYLRKNQNKILFLIGIPYLVGHNIWIHNCWNKHYE